jgi:hypothetical protein
MIVCQLLLSPLLLSCSFLFSLTTHASHGTVQNSRKNLAAKLTGSRRDPLARKPQKSTTFLSLSQSRNSEKKEENQKIPTQIALY